jgi:hypothetical protein
MAIINVNIPIEDAVTDGSLNPVTSNAVFDALALKANSADLALVATSGDYNDLSNLPTIPSAQVNSDWNATSGVAEILNKPTIPSVTGFVPYTGATNNLDMGTHNVTATQGTFATSGNPDTLTVNHSSGSGKALTITKGGNGEGVYVNKTSGSGNAVTVIGDLEATNLKRTGGTSSQFLKANGSIDSTSYQPTLVSGTNIKTINGTTLLGSGDIAISTGLTIGTTPITSGTVGRILFQGAGNVLQQDSNITFDSTLKRLTLKAVGTLSTNIPFSVRNSADTRDIIRIQGNESTVLQSGQYASCTFVQDGNEAATLILRTIGNLQAELGNDFNAAPGSTYTGALKLYNWGSVLRTRIQAVGTSYLADSTSRLVIGSTTAGARLDVRAQGALSTDIAFRVRNSVDTANLFTVKGNGVLNAANLPTSPVGLVTGDIWNNLGILTIV